MSTEEMKKTGMHENEETSPLIIGIGASAGGLEALQQFFDYMPPNSGLTFVVIQHLSPDYKSLMADILGKHTEMNVCQVDDSMVVEPDTVYLIPPKKYMTIKEGKLHLSDAPGTLNHPHPEPLAGSAFPSFAERTGLKRQSPLRQISSLVPVTRRAASLRSQSCAAGAEGESSSMTGVSVPSRARSCMFRNSAEPDFP